MEQFHKVGNLEASKSLADLDHYNIGSVQCLRITVFILNIYKIKSLVACL